MHNFLKRLSGLAIHGSVEVDVNDDQPPTINEPVIMSTDLDDKSTDVARGRNGVKKRFRRWAGKRLRSMCCVWTPRDDPSCRKDTCGVNDIGNKGKGPLNNSPAKKTKNGIETKINEITNQLIITNESKNILNSAHSDQYVPGNVETVLKSNKNDNNTESLGDSLPRTQESDLLCENGRRRDERFLVRTAETLIPETNKCGSIVKNTKSTTSLQIDNARPEKIVSVVTTATQSFGDERYSITKPKYDNIPEIIHMKLSRENKQKQDERNSANEANHSTSDKFEQTQLPMKPTALRKLDIESKRDFVFKTKAANHILRKQNPIIMPRYEDISCSQESNLQRNDKQARDERNSINTAESRIFEKYGHSHLQTIPTVSRKLYVDCKRDFVFKTKAANHILRKQQDSIAMPLYKDLPGEKYLPSGNRRARNEQNSVNTAEQRIFQKYKRSQLQTNLTASRKSDIHSKGKFLSISAAAEYNFKKRQDSVTMPCYENLTGYQVRNLSRNNRQTGNERNSVNTTESRNFQKHERSHLQNNPMMSRKLDIDSKRDIVLKTKAAYHILQKQHYPIAVPLYKDRPCSQERKLQGDHEQTGEVRSLVNNTEPRILESVNRDHQQDTTSNTSVHDTRQDNVGNNATHQGQNDQLS